MDYKVFLDTNCIIDLLLRRANEWKTVRSICEKVNPDNLAISSLSIPNANYIAKVNRSNRDKFKDFVMGFFIISLNGGIIHRAFQKNMRDFEDAIQLASAESVSADYLLTWNVKDYKGQKSLVKVMNPREFLSLIDDADNII